MLGPADVLALEQYQQHEQEPAAAAAVIGRRGRKRKLPLAEMEPIVPEEDMPREVVEQQQPPLETIPEMSLPNESLMPPPPTPQYSGLGSPNSSIPLAMGSLPNVPLTPGSLAMGGMTPLGITHGESSLGIQPGSMTPLNIPPGVMTPLRDFSTSDLPHPAFTPAGLDHGGGMTPHHGIEHLESIPNLPADQVSSILNGTGMDNMGYSNMGYDDGQPQIQHGVSPRAGGMSERVAPDYHEDYDFPPSVGPAVSILNWNGFNFLLEKR